MNILLHKVAIVLTAILTSSLPRVVRTGLRRVGHLWNLGEHE